MNIEFTEGELDSDDCALQTFTGRIESDLALQYPGNPEVSLSVGGETPLCRQYLGTSRPVSPVSRSTLGVGGRYLLLGAATAAAPWPAPIAPSSESPRRTCCQVSRLAPQSVSMA